MHANIVLKDINGKDFRKVKVDKNFNISKFLEENNYNPRDLDIKNFLSAINKSLNKDFKTFLFIDDGPDLIELLVYEASEIGHYAEGFTDSDAGYGRYSSNQDLFDIIVLDYIMPGLNGGRVADAFMVKDKDAKIVLLTGNSKIKASKINKIPIIFKPARIKDIIEAAEVYDYQNNKFFKAS